MVSFLIHRKKIATLKTKIHIDKSYTDSVFKQGGTVNNTVAIRYLQSTQYGPFFFTFRMDVICSLILCSSIYEAKKKISQSRREKVQSRPEDKSMEPREPFTIVLFFLGMQQRVRENDRSPFFAILPRFRSSSTIKFASPPSEHL